MVADAVTVVVVPLVGAYVAVRRPSNPVGWVEDDGIGLPARYVVGLASTRCERAPASSAARWFSTAVSVRERASS